jgi:hypothetical protein
MWPVTSTNEVTDQYESADPPSGDPGLEPESQTVGTQQDHTVTQSRFSGLGLPEEEYPDGTVLIWRFEEVPAACAMRDERLAQVVGYGDARWWTPKGAATWDQLRDIASGNPPPTVLRAWSSRSPDEESAGDTLDRLGTDAQLWAREFVALAPPTDVGTMIGWFANAIETGRSAGYSRGYHAGYSRGYHDGSGGISITGAER